MKFVLAFAVMYFILPIFQPETQTPASAQPGYVFSLTTKAAQEKAVDRMTSSLSEKLSLTVTALIEKALDSQTSSETNNQIDNRGLVVLRETCDPTLVEGDEIYDLNRSITMLFHVLPDDALDPAA
jgi:uncharacterized membrane protein